MYSKISYLRSKLTHANIVLFFNCFCIITIILIANTVLLEWVIHFSNTFFIVIIIGLFLALFIALCVYCTVKFIEKNKALILSEETFRSANNYAVIGMALVSPQGRWLKVNPALCELVGYSEDELLATNFQSLTYPDDLDIDLDFVQKVLTKKVNSYEIEKRYIHKHGQIIWVLLNVSLVWHANGTPKYFVSQIQNITERKLMNDVLSRHVALLHLANDAILVRNKNDVITFWNKGAEQTYGWNTDEAMGQLTHKLLQTQFPKQLDEIEQELYKQKTWNGELIHTTRWGKKLIVESRWALECDQEGVPIGVLEINRDVSERKKIEAELHEREKKLVVLNQNLEEMIQKLLASNTELERFAYIASHDLQEPIRMITNFSHIIVADYKDKLDDEGMDYLNIIADAGTRMHDTVNDLLDYSRVDNEANQSVFFDGEELFLSTLANIRVLLYEKNVHITHDHLPCFYGNLIQFRRVLQNLIINAIKYQEPNKQPIIHIGLNSDDAAYWCISVTDNGLGIASNFLAEIFQPFRRLHTWDEIKGTGLGLSICKKIIENHGGRLWVESTVGIGSIFYFTLPKVKEQ